MATIDNCLSKLRRRVGDTDEPYAFDDGLLVDYINDAVDLVELDYTRGYSLTDLGNFNKSPSSIDCTLFAIKAHWLFKLRTKDKADRDNFLLRKGRLTLDNTEQADDHGKTLEIIDKEYRETLFRVKNKGTKIKGVRME